MIGTKCSDLQLGTFGTFVCGRSSRARIWDLYKTKVPKVPDRLASKHKADP
jgi:hypothetical protein